MLEFILDFLTLLIVRLVAHTVEALLNRALPVSIHDVGVTVVIK